MADNLEHAMAHIANASGITVVVAGRNEGAGISVAANIPAFRGENGQHKTKFEGYTIQDLFNFQTISRDSTAYRAFCKYIALMAKKAIQAQPTRSHQLLRILDDYGLLSRIFSQNIDGLEAKAGFDLFSVEKSSKCILLHGDISTIRCEKCVSSYMIEDFLPFLQVGEAIACPACEKASGTRKRTPGRLRPNVLLFDEESATAEGVMKIVTSDCKLVKENHVLLVLGTSLKILGIQSIIKDFNSAMRRFQKVACIYVDIAPNMPSTLPIGTLHIGMDCQEFAELTISKIKNRFSDQEVLDFERADFRPLWDWS